MEAGATGGRAHVGTAWTVEIRLPFFSPEAWIRPQGVRSIDVVYRNAVTGESLPPARILTAEMLAHGKAYDPEAN